MPLFFLLLILATMITLAYQSSGMRVVILVMLIVPLVSLAWVGFQAIGQHNPRNIMKQRTADYLFVQIAGFRNEMILLMMAGFLGTVASPVLAILIDWFHLDLTAVPGWSILVLIVWFIPVAGQFGMNPILAATLIIPVLPTTADLGITRATHTLAPSGPHFVRSKSLPAILSTNVTGTDLGAAAPEG